MDVRTRIAEHGGVAHRADLRRLGVTDYRIRRALENGSVRSMNGGWLSVVGAEATVLRATQLGGRVACVSAAALRGVWVLTDDRDHITVPARSSATAPAGVRLHRSRPRVPMPRSARIESVVDMLEHVAICLPFEEALAVWESTIRKGLVAPSALKTVRWRRLTSRALAAAASALADSGLESLVVSRLRSWGLSVQQQVALLGHRVDILVGERLVVQIDGWEFHSSAADRARDNRHDTRLRLAGFTVIRLGYAEVVHGWTTIESELQMALAQGLHLA